MQAEKNRDFSEKFSEEDGTGDTDSTSVFKFKRSSGSQERQSHGTSFQRPCKRGGEHLFATPDLPKFVNIAYGVSNAFSRRARICRRHLFRI